MDENNSTSHLRKFMTSLGNQTQIEPARAITLDEQEWVFVATTQQRDALCAEISMAADNFGDGEIQKFNALPLPFWVSPLFGE